MSTGYVLADTNIEVPIFFEISPSNIIGLKLYNLGKKFLCEKANLFISNTGYKKL
jgi:hypothetical protein